VEWAKCKARADRWEEEVIILKEEMQRVVEYMGWKARWWSQQAGRSLGDVDNEERQPGPSLHEGQRAYSMRQTDTFQTLGISFAKQWQAVLLSHNVSVSWPKYVDSSLIGLPPQRTRKRKAGTMLVEEQAEDAPSPVVLNSPAALELGDLDELDFFD
jgi:hypothetical protein